MFVNPPPPPAYPPPAHTHKHLHACIGQPPHGCTHMPIAVLFALQQPGRRPHANTGDCLFLAPLCSLCWLMPSAASQGYLPSDLYNLDTQYGSAKQLSQLVRAAHRRRLKVVLDVVLNHRCANHQVCPLALLTTSGLGKPSVLSPPFFYVSVAVPSVCNPSTPRSPLASPCISGFPRVNRLPSSIHALCHSLVPGLTRPAPPCHTKTKRKRGPNSNSSSLRSHAIAG